MGSGIGHYIPLVAYLGFWVMCIVSLTGRPLLGLYYLMPFLPYRTMRDHFLDYPLGGNVLTLLTIAVIVGALMKGKRLPQSKLYKVWLIFGVYLYLSLWIGTILGNGPAPLWLSDINFVTWKDYMLIPLLFVAAGLVVEDRKAIRTVIMISALSVLFIDRSALMDSLSHTWTSFDENKRDGGPLGYGSNQTAAFLAQFALFFWGFGQYIRKKWKIIAYGLVAVTLLADMYTFSRASYIAIVAAVFLLGILKDRKLLILGVVFLFTWQVVVPISVSERVNMTHSSDGKLEASAQERVSLWEDAENYISANPVFGTGYATYQLTPHVDGLRDTHNWYVKVMVETGAIGMLLALWLFQQMYALSWKLFRRMTDPLYKGLGLGLLLCVFVSTITNFFGDRWTYLEITGLLWVLFGAASRALQLSEQQENAGAEAEQAHLPAHLRNFPSAAPSSRPHRLPGERWA